MLKNLLNRKNMSIYRLAKETGIAYSTLNYIVNERTQMRKCNVKTFRKIAEALNMSMDELYAECTCTEDGNQTVSKDEKL